MLIIGERINSTRKRIQEYIKTRDSQAVIKEAVSQLEAGANFIDLNCAVTSGDEIQDMDWLVSAIQNEIPDVSICIDSPNHLAIEKGLSKYKAKGKIIINSITADEVRISNILPLAIKYSTGLIALTMDERGMPDTAQDRYEVAKRIVEIVEKKGFKKENLYFDPLIRPISTEPKQAVEFLKAIPLIKSLGVKTICGLSNVSFGLPERSIINSVFLAMAIQNGLDAAILDPTDKNILSSAYAAGALIGVDEYCADYIKAFRAGKLTR